MENCFSLASLNNKQSTWADDRVFKCLLFRALSAKFVFSSPMKSPCRVKAHKGLSHPSQFSSAAAVSRGEPGWAAAPGGQIFRITGLICWQGAGIRQSPAPAPSMGVLCAGPAQAGAVFTYSKLPWPSSSFFNPFHPSLSVINSLNGRDRDKKLRVGQSTELISPASSSLL